MTTQVTQPLIELVDEREFTDREDELAFFWNLAMKARKRLASSYTLIARKGVGKTAILQRLYNRLFLEQTEVIPFYVSLAEFKNGRGTERFTVWQFTHVYFVTLLKQYIGFRTRDAALVQEREIGVERLEQIAQQRGLDELGKWFAAYRDFREHNEQNQALYYALDFTFTHLYQMGMAGLLIVDEFQVLTMLWDELIDQWRDITDAFQRTAEAKWCPMVVSGSAVSLISRTVFGGLLARRFGPYYLDPFPPRYSVEYALKLAHLQGVQLSDAVAYEIHSLTGGNPHYIWCLFNSLGLKGDDLSTLEQLRQVYEYEMTGRAGKLKGLWDTHFFDYTDKIGETSVSLPLLYHLATHPAQDIGLNELAAVSDIEDRFEVKRVLMDLEEADLVERDVGRYVGITDPVLADYIARAYKDLFEGPNLVKYKQFLTQEFWRKMGSLNRAIGEAAELLTLILLGRFDGQAVEAAAVFGMDEGEVQLPHFHTIRRRSGVIVEGRPIELDLMAEAEEEQWLVEVKYWRQPVPAAEVDKFVEKGQALSLPMEDIQLWFFSRSGFEPAAVARLRELGIRHSDSEDFNRLAEIVGAPPLPAVSQWPEAVP